MNFSKVTGYIRIPTCLLLLITSTSWGQTLKIATLAPEGSAWTDALRTIDSRLRTATNGTVQFKIYAGGIQGDEPVVLRKIRIGQLHGGGFAGPSMSQILPDVLALQMPFLFNEYREIDYVLKETEAHFQRRYGERGYVHLGWTDVGFVHLFSHQPIQDLEALKAHTVWRLEGEPITEILFRLGDIRSIPLTIPDVLMGLQTNLVDVVYASPAAAIVLQWHTRVSHINELPINYSPGALLVAQKAFNKLKPDHQILLRAIAREEMQTLTIQMRKDNRSALEVLQKSGLQLHTSSQEDLASFNPLIEGTEKELVGGILPLDIHQLIRSLLSDFRSVPQPSQ